MGAFDRIEVNTLKIVHAKFGSLVQQSTELIGFGRLDHEERLG